MTSKNLCLKDKITYLLCLKEIQIKVPKYINKIIFDFVNKQHKFYLFVISAFNKILNRYHYNNDAPTIFNLKTCPLNVNINFINYIILYKPTYVIKLLCNTYLSNECINYIYTNEKYKNVAYMHIIAMAILTEKFLPIDKEREIFNYCKSIDYSKYFGPLFSSNFIESLCTISSIEDFIYMVENFDVFHANFNNKGVFQLITIMMKNIGCGKSR